MNDSLVFALAVIVGFALFGFVVAAFAFRAAEDARKAAEDARKRDKEAPIPMPDHHP